MNPLLFTVLALIAVSSCISGYLFSFKERYKEWYKKLFKDGVKPVQWSLSRQTNHDRYKLSHFVQLTTVVVFLAISMLCVESMTISLWLYFIVLSVTAVVPEILGGYCGNRRCDKKVRQECRKHGIDIPTL